MFVWKTTERQHSHTCGSTVLQFFFLFWRKREILTYALQCTGCPPLDYIVLLHTFDEVWGPRLPPVTPYTCVAKSVPNCTAFAWWGIGTVHRWDLWTITAGGWVCRGRHDDVVGTGQNILRGFMEWWQLKLNLQAGLMGLRWGCAIHPFEIKIGFMRRADVKNLRKSSNQFSSPLLPL